MASFLLYLIKSAICLTLFYLFFVGVMRQSTLFRFNRLTLLAGSVVCLLLPLIPFTVSESQTIQLPMLILDGMLTGAVEGGETMQISLPSVVGSDTLLTIPTVSTSIPFLFVAYLAGMLFTLGLTLNAFLRVGKILRLAPVRRENGYKLIVLPEPIHSFSFGRYIVLSEEDYTKHPQVLVHEQMHLRYRHTLDSLWFMLIVIVYWFNPLVWLMRQELLQLHEYEADEGVINQGIDATQYQLLLVKKAVGARLYSIANGFNHSKLKNRITMLLKEKTNGRARLRLLLVLPVAMGTLFAFAHPEVKETLETMVPQVTQQDPSAEFEELKNFFSQKKSEYMNKYLLQPDGGYVVKFDQLQDFTIDKENTLSVHPSNQKVTEYYTPNAPMVRKQAETANLRADLAAYIRMVHQKRKAAIKEEDEAINFMFKCDEQADKAVVVQYLKALKGAIDDVRQDYAEADRDKYVPYAMNFEVLESRPKK